MAISFPQGAVLDVFTGVNGTTLPAYSANWTLIAAGAVPTLQIQSNAATGTAVGNNGNFWNPRKYGPNCDAFIQVTTKPTNGGVVFIFARTVDPTALATLSGYATFYVENLAGTDTIGIYRFDGGTPTQLGSSVNQEVSAGDAIGVRCIGNQIQSWYYNGATWALMDTQTDSTYSAPGYISLLLSDAINTVRLDNFGGGNIAIGNEIGGSIVGGTTVGGMAAR